MKAWEREVLEALAGKVRAFSVEQVRGAWWPPSQSGMRVGLQGETGPGGEVGQRSRWHERRKARLLRELPDQRSVSARATQLPTFDRAKQGTFLFAHDTPLETPCVRRARRLELPSSPQDHEPF